MSLPDADYRTADPTTRVRRDAIALLLIVLGAVGLLSTLWVIDPLAFAVALSVAVLAAGVYLGFER